jgi:transketolase
VIYSPDEEFGIGRAKIIRQSAEDKATIVSSGVTLFEALAAHDDLKAQGFPVRVIDLFSIKPIDGETLRMSARQTHNLIITDEDHSAWGGIGDAVAGAVGPAGIRVLQLGVREVPRSGKPDELLAAYGIDRASIVRAVMQGIGE